MGPAQTRQPSGIRAGERTRRFHSLEMRRFAKPDGPTLDQRIGATWTRLVEHGSAECPVCSGELRTTGCADCGSALS